MEKILVRELREKPQGGVWPEGRGREGRGLEGNHSSDGDALLSCI